MLLEGSCLCGTGVPSAAGTDKPFDVYRDEMIAGWHERLVLVRA